jgi:hypothetical protein
VAIKARLDGSFEKETKRATGYADKLGNAFTKKLVGAGAVVGLVKKSVGLLADELKRGQEAGEAFNVTMASFSEKLATSIPILSDLFQIGQAIRAEIDGSAREMRRLTREANSPKSMELQRMGDQLQRAGKLLADMRRKTDAIGIAAEIVAAKETGLARVVQQVNEELSRRAAILAAISLQDAFDERAQALRIERILLTQGAEAAERYKLALEGFTPAMIDWLREQERINEELREQQRLAEEAARAEEERRKSLERSAEAVRNSILTPLERYRKQLELLKELLEESLLTQEEFTKAVALAQEDLRQALGGIRKLERPGAVEQRFTGSFPGADRMVDPLKELEKTEKSNLLETKRHTPLFYDIRNSLRTQATPQIVAF